MNGFKRTADERAAREEQAVRDYAERSGIGFGRLMQLGQKLWREHLLASGYPAGGEFTIGPCAAEMVPCQCVELGDVVDPNGAFRGCDWCCCTRLVTKHVRSIQVEGQALRLLLREACDIAHARTTELGSGDYKRITEIRAEAKLP